MLRWALLGGARSWNSDRLLTLDNIMTWSETALISAVSVVLAAIGTVFIMSGVQAVLGV
jgi:hypothetical protein